MKIKLGKSYVLWILAIVLIVVWLFAYGHKEGPVDILQDQKASLQDTKEALEKEIESITGEKEEPQEIRQMQETLINIIAAPSQNKIYEETAEMGEGVTSLARKAFLNYVKDQRKDINSFSPEHMVYIEDYMQNETGNQWLQLGQKVSFSEDLIRDAFGASSELGASQIDNLTQYASAPGVMAYLIE